MDKNAGMANSSKGKKSQRFTNSIFIFSLQLMFKLTEGLAYESYPGNCKLRQTIKLRNYDDNMFFRH